MKILDTNSKFSDTGLLVIRVGIGFFFAFVFGWPKISGGPEFWDMLGKAMNNLGIDFLPVFWGFMGAAAEFLGGILLILGLAFRPALVFMGVTMIVAFSQGLAGGQPFSQSTHPLELFLVFVGLFLTGPGKYSLDAVITNKSKI